MLDAIRLIFDWAALRNVGFDAVVYSAIAIIGTLLFFLRLILGLFLDVEGMSEADVDIDSDGSAAFGIFSFLSVTAFLMTTGWVGLGTRLDLGLAMLPSAAISVTSGVIVMGLTGFFMIAVRRLAQEQTYDLKTTIGHIGQVYLTIPENGSGSGKVQITVSGRHMVVDARTEGPKIDAFTDIRVIAVRDDGMLVVEKVS